MAAGIPIVAKYAPNLTEFITNNKNGILVKKNVDFSKAIVNVLTNKKLSQKLATNGLETAKSYSVQEFGDKLEMLYTEIIKNHQLRKTFSSKKEKQKQKKNLYKVITDKLLSLTRL